MKKLNPIERSHYIDQHYKEYLRSSFRFGSEELQQMYEDELKRSDLFRGPYLALDLPFQRGRSINELVDSGELCQSFLRLSDVDFNRPLYAHQEEAIKRISSGRSTVVTTGTGSGKTECFLYPILNELLQDIENGNQDVGIRAIFLYPMNALVNDQMDRIRRMLGKCPEITFGSFTGETKEKVASNYREKYYEENGILIPENELVSREEIRENPPHLLFTNYSMLEFLLIRPNDYSLFKGKRLKNWKFVVLDEAHTYSGSLGIEISLLMRRLTGLASKKPRFILTSATLGEQGKSEKEIVKFARSLTSVSFDQEDIIFSKRICPDASAVCYTVVPSDYTELKNYVDSPDKVRSICDKYGIETGHDIADCLYRLLQADRTVYNLYLLLKEGSKTIDQVLRELEDSVTAAELSALIDLINKAEHKGVGLYDLKYHSFVRPLAGAYITVGENAKLSLTKTNTIDGKKAFEVGNCRYCNAPYILGKIQRDINTGLDFLCQNAEVDIYENYGMNDFAAVDYFLFHDEIHEKADKSRLENYVLCGKCGNIYPADNLNAKHCKCDEEYKKTVFRVIQSRENEAKETAKNNLSKCPCCGLGQSGVVKSLNLGKDEGTALAAQMLYESQDDNTEPEKVSTRLSLKARTKTSRSERSDPNQFLVFSDSRQQASFAAVFFDSVHIRMLRKRLIWRILEDNNYQDMSLDDMTAQLTSFIKTRELFPNDMSPQKNAWAAVLVDLLQVDGNYDGEGVGLYYFDLNLDEIMEHFTEEDVEEAFGQYKISKSDLEVLIQVVFRIFKVAPAIDYTKSSMTQEEKKETLSYRRFDNYIAYQCSKGTDGVRSFLPIKSKENMVVRYVMKACGCSADEAVDILDILFHNLGVEGNILKKHPSKDEYQIEAGRYVIKSYKYHKYYQCVKCGRLTPYNVHNVCVQDKCKGRLIEVDPDDVLKDNYYRNQYMQKKIENIVIREHTAQLGRKTARQYQQEFKDKKINILSCSTTFEMGIDLGDLETVFMRNVPPTPANYVQRAGRAGRRKNSSAYILTYCSTNSHDYTYFRDPGKMISGVIRPPFFDVFNQKIIVRHLMAASLGYFFRANPSYFKSVEVFVFGGGAEAFNLYVQSHPDDLNRYINKKILPESKYEMYHDFKWFDEMGGEDVKLQHFVESVKEKVSELESGKNAALEQNNYGDAEKYSQQIKIIKQEKMLEALSKYCVIPKYGFPVDVVNLQIYDKGWLNQKYDLQRDLRIAISEYAPDSEVIVDGKKYTSKYLSLPRKNDLPQRYFFTCTNCKKITVYLYDNDSQNCRYCGETLETQLSEFYLQPVEGFRTGLTKESTQLKPKRSYAGEVSYLGGGKISEKSLTIKKFMTLESSTDDELLVVNKSAFYMCPICGYSDIIKKKSFASTSMKPHSNYRQLKCANDKLKRIRIGHSFRTDVTRIMMPVLDVYGVESYAIALSFLYAFLEGVSKALEIERTDIDGLVEMNNEKGCYDVLLFDNVPGGAGHVKRLMNKDAVIASLNAALEKVSQNCCDENTSCYNCLRNYYNQSYHAKLKRIYARGVIEQLLAEIKR